MSRSRRILDLVNPSNGPQNDRNFELTDTHVGGDLRKRRKRESSPLPAGSEEELVQLEDLLGDIFNDCEKSHEEKIPVIINPSQVIPAIHLKAPAPNVPAPNSLAMTFNSPKVLETNEDEVVIQIESKISTPMPSPSSSWVLIEVDDEGVNSGMSQTSSVNNALSTLEVYENMVTPSEFSCNSNVPTPSSTITSRKKTFKSDKGRKRLVHKEKWVVVQRKLKKNTGEEFVNQSGKLVESKQMKDPCTDKCRLKCTQKRIKI